MFQIFKDPKIDFMGKRNLWLAISIVLNVAALIIVPLRGLHLGIEFTGGTEIQVKYASTPDLGSIRSALTAAGFPNHIVTTIGAPSENEVYIRLGVRSEKVGEDVTQKVIEALRGQDARRAAGQVDLNVAGVDALESLLQGFPDITRDDAKVLAERISGKRKEVAVLRAVDDLSGLDKMTPQVLDYLKGHCFVGPFAIRSQSYIGPTVGRELVQKAAFAILGSLAAMLAYIGWRFQLRWGVAAVVALAHDTMVTLGLFSLSGKEMSLPVVAAFLTLVGYSVNDTVVVFDRIRENMKLRGGSDLPGLINLSINQTLSRTILTSGLTWIVVLALLFFGGEALNPFSFVMTVGIVVGTYSSIYIASPILVIWQQFLDRRKGVRRTSTPPAKAASEKKARKVRTTVAG